MAKQMVQFRYTEGDPDIKRIAALLKIDPAEIDDEFGIVATDPDANLYTILVTEAAAAKADAQLRKKDNADPAEGAFGNARIAPFGGDEQ